MNIKKFDIVKLDFEVETNNPIIARLIVLLRINKLIIFAKIHPEICGKKIGKPFYRLYIPKIKFVSGSDSL